MTDKRKHFERARRPGEKAVRRDAILEAASRLLERGRIQEVSLNQIAQEAGLTKPNLYRYFESREEILLSLFHEDLSEFADEVVGGLALVVCQQAQRDEAVAAVLVKAYGKQPRLCRFLGMISSVFEHNVSASVIESSKAATLEQALRVAGSLNKALPGMTLERCLWLNNMTALLVAGLWPPAHPAGPANEVLSKPAYRLLRPDFRRDLHMAIVTLIRGSRD